MKIDDRMIDKIAGLAYLEFRDEEKEKIRKDLEQILTFVEKLKELDTDRVDPLIYLSDNPDVLREDRIIHSLNRDEALLNAPDKSDGFFRVPKVIKK
jgi:aspartyl-tRNA(Asn)/glutamyl-tRNA(Gln) amidotransferase subunit C